MLRYTSKALVTGGAFLHNIGVRLWSILSIAIFAMLLSSCEQHMFINPEHASIVENELYTRFDSATVRRIKQLANDTTFQNEILASLQVQEGVNAHLFSLDSVGRTAYIDSLQQASQSSFAFVASVLQMSENELNEHVEAAAERAARIEAAHFSGAPSSISPTVIREEAIALAVEDEPTIAVAFDSMMVEVQPDPRGLCKKIFVAKSAAYLAAYGGAITGCLALGVPHLVATCSGFATAGYTAGLVLAAFEYEQCLLTVNPQSSTSR